MANNPETEQPETSWGVGATQPPPITSTGTGLWTESYGPVPASSTGSRVS